MSPDRLSTTFAALGDPTRRAILARLISGEASVTELAEPFAMSLPAVSKHLKVLEHAGLITRGREAQWRPCRLEAGPPKDAAHRLQHHRPFLGKSLRRPGSYLRGVEKRGERKGRKKEGRQRIDGGGGPPHRGPGGRRARWASR